MERKFTLIEILGVTILIAILAAIGIAGYTYAVESAKESATKALIARVSTALEALRAEGIMPKTDFSGGTSFVTIRFPEIKIDNSGNVDKDSLLLFVKDDSHQEKDPESEKEKKERVKRHNIFAKAISGDGMKRHLNSDDLIIDGWGNPIYIRYPGKFNRGGFDIISAGADGDFGSEGKDKPVEDSAKYRNSDGEWLCDDIANF